MTGYFKKIFLMGLMGALATAAYALWSGMIGLSGGHPGFERYGGSPSAYAAGITVLPVQAPKAEPVSSSSSSNSNADASASPIVQAIRDSLQRNDLASARVLLDAVQALHKDNDQTMRLRASLQAREDETSPSLPAPAVREQKPLKAQRVTRSAATKVALPVQSAATSSSTKVASTRSASTKATSTQSASASASASTSASTKATSKQTASAATSTKASSKQLASAKAASTQSAFASPSTKTASTKSARPLATAKRAPRDGSSPARESVAGTASHRKPVKAASHDDEVKSASTSANADAGSSARRVAPPLPGATRVAQSTRATRPVVQAAVPVPPNVSPAASPQRPLTREEVRADLERARADGSIPRFGNPNPAGPGGVPSEAPHLTGTAWVSN